MSPSLSEYIRTAVEIGMAIGTGIAAVFFIPLVAIMVLVIIGAVAGGIFLSILFFLIWCEDQWEAFKRWRQR